MTGHGYGPYTNGCRCDICRAAKAAYQANRRAAASLATTPVPDGLTHGRAGYEEHGCRCEICVKAKREEWVRSSRLRRERGQT